MMKIRIAFTLDIPASSMAEMIELAATADPAEIRDFLREEAKDHVWEYLDANAVTGVRVKMEGGDMTWP